MPKSKAAGPGADRVGVTGHCRGGSTVYQQAPFLGLYGDLLKQTNPNSEIVIYPGAGHGSFAGYRPSYNARAAADAWKRCTGLFAKTLNKA